MPHESESQPGGLISSETVDLSNAVLFSCVMRNVHQGRQSVLGRDQYLQRLACHIAALVPRFVGRRKLCVPDRGDHWALAKNAQEIHAISSSATCGRYCGQRRAPPSSSQSKPIQISSSGMMEVIPWSAQVNRRPESPPQPLVRESGGLCAPSSRLAHTLTAGCA